MIWWGETNSPLLDAGERVGAQCNTSCCAWLLGGWVRWHLFCVELHSSALVRSLTPCAPRCCDADTRCLTNSFCTCACCAWGLAREAV